MQTGGGGAFAAIRLDTRDAGKLFARIPVFLRSTSLFRFQHILGIGEQVINFSGSLSNFFYGVDLESIEDVGFISLGVDDELDLLVPSNELGARLHLPASVVEVHVAACRLRRIVPLGIRPNGTIRLRGERPSSGSTRPFELSSVVFLLCAKR